MKFTKMQGIGNDYVYVNGFEETVEDPAAAAVFVSNRNFGIGSDGLILILPSETADCRMDMYNMDGSRGAMCGNGIRCVGKYVYDHGIVTKTEIDVETASGLRHLSLHVSDGKVDAVTVDMGSPVLTSEIGEPIRVGEETFRFTGISMGNPHAVVFLDEAESLGGSLTELNLTQLHSLLISNGWTWVTALCTLLFSLLHWPCSTTCLTIKKETGSWKWTALAFIIPTVCGMALCMAVNLFAHLTGLG